MSRRLLLMLGCAVLVVMLSVGLRQTFGVFLRPVSESLDIGRQTFGLVIAVQTLLFGIVQPLAGVLADRVGTVSVVVAGALIYAGGLALAGLVTEAATLYLSLGVVVAVGLTGTTQVVVLGAVAKVVPSARRGVVFGTIIASGSLGMFWMVPTVQGLIGGIGWRGAFFVLAAIILLVPLVALGLRSPPSTERTATQSLSDAIAEARRHRSYLLLTAGFFVCGFHVTFVGTHLPAFLADSRVSTTAAAYAFGLIGLANVAGAYLFGALGDRFRKKRVLVAIYLGRTVLMSLVLVIPMTDLTALLFGGIMGLLWLSTVPLTSGIVAQMFGTRYFSTLYGVVFMSHQLGGFCGAWLGGLTYDSTGSYDLMWAAAALLGLTAAVLHWPIDDRPLERLAAPAA